MGSSALGALYLVAYAVLGGLLWLTHGHFDLRPLRVWFFTLSLTSALSLVAALRSPRPSGGSSGGWVSGWVGRMLPALVLVGSLGLLAFDPAIYAPVTPALRGLLYVLAALGVTSLVMTAVGRSNYFVLLGVGVGLLAARVVFLVDAPDPTIDVFTTSARGAEYLLNGDNPYTGSYEDIYRGRYDYAPAYSYWPLVLILQAGFQAVFGEVRAAFIACDVLTVLGLYRWFGSRDFAVPATLYLAFPVGLFVLEQAWVDPILITCVVWTLAMASERRWVAAGVFLGLAAATRQYAVIFAALLGLSLLARRDLRSFSRLAGVALATFLVVVLPFVLWNPSAFFEATVSILAHAGFRSDSFSLLAFMHFFGTFDPTEQSWLFVGPPLVFLPVASWFVVRGRARLDVILVAHFLWFSVVLLFAKQAFCNYYAYLSLFLLLTWAARSSSVEDRVHADPL